MPRQKARLHGCRPAAWHHEWVDTDLTLTEAASILQPPITEPQLRAIIRALRIQPAGSRRNGHPGKPHATYTWTEISQLHHALTPWLGEP